MLCPFIKKTEYLGTVKNNVSKGLYMDTLEKPQECIRRKCMMWAGSDCGLKAVKK